MSISRAGARQKGHQWERDVANDLKKVDPEARRNVSESQQGGLDICTTLPWSIQCKSWANEKNCLKALEQANEHKTKDSMPVALVKVNRQKPIAVLYYDDYLSLVKLLNSLQIYQL